MRTRYGVVAALLAALVCAGVTTAGVPGRWDTIAQGASTPGDSASELGVARTRDGVLHVAWKERTGTTEAIRHRTVSASGRVGPVSTIVAGWSSLGDPELVTEAGGGLRVYFGGERTAQPDEPLTGLLTATASASGASWSQASSIHTGDVVGSARNPSATVARNGTHYQTWYGGSGILLRRGLAPGTTAYPLAKAAPTEFGPTVVEDAAGRLWVSWCGFGGNGGGLFVQRADPATGAPTGAVRKLPGSTTAFQGRQTSTCNLERTVARRTPMVARAGGGVFIAGAAGYPTLSRVLVWRIDPSGQVPGGSFLVGSAAGFGHGTPALADAPDGRVWVAWLENRPGRPVIAARRSNRLGTAWGEPVRVVSPRGWMLGALNIAAQDDRLDVLGLMSSAGGSKRVGHTQLLPGLTLEHLRTVRRADGTVGLSFRVLDAGEPVRGARVTAEGATSWTFESGTGGQAGVIVPTPTRGILRATASKAGYASHTIRFRCC